MNDSGKSLLTFDSGVRDGEWSDKDGYGDEKLSFYTTISRQLVLKRKNISKNKVPRF